MTIHLELTENEHEELLQAIKYHTEVLESMLDEYTDAPDDWLSEIKSIQHSIDVLNNIYGRLKNDA